MTNLICNIQDILGTPIEGGVVRLSAENIQSDGLVTVLPKFREQELVNGTTTFTGVKPGRVIIQVTWEAHTRTIRAYVPSVEEVSLSDLQHQVYDQEPAVVGKVIDAANRSEDAAYRAEADAATVGDAQTVLTARDQAVTAAGTAEGIATALPTTISTELHTRVPPMVADAIAADSTVAAAAASAVTGAVTEQLVISDGRLVGDAVSGIVTEEYTAPVPEMVTQDVPEVETARVPVTWPTLDASGLLPESMIPGVSQEAALARVLSIVSATTAPSIISPSSLSSTGGARMPIPTHDGSGQAVHPYVRHFPQGVWGYTWWMAVTGYAGRSTEHEDPLLLASHTGLPGSWVAPAGVPFPMDDSGTQGAGEGYNSDACLEYDPLTGRMWLFWRHFMSTGDPTYTTLYVRSSVDGVTWTDAEIVMEIDHWQPGTAPYFILNDDRTWSLFSTRTNTLGQLEMQTAPELFGPWSPPEVTDLVLPGGMRLWHCEVRRVGPWYLALAQNRTTEGNGGGELRVAVSPHPLTGWQVAPDSIVPRTTADHDWLYQGTLVPYSLDGEWLWRTYYSGFSNTGASESWLYYTELEKI